MSQLPDLLPQDLARYSRHLLLPEFGLAGQKRLKAARVLIAGAGGLGSPVLLYLSAAGVGWLGLIDGDVVDISNLSRQILFSTADIGQKKVECAAKRAQALNPGINLIAHRGKLSADNALSLISQYDVIVDATDNFAARYLINDACVRAGKPDVYGSIYRWQGQASVFAAGQGPCYRCLYQQSPAPETIPNCTEAGVLGAVAGIIGAVQANETIKLLLTLGNLLTGRLLLYDALAMRFDTVELKADKNCPACADRSSITAMNKQACSGLPGNDHAGEITASDLRQALACGKKLLLLDVRNDDEYASGHLENSCHIPLPYLEAKMGQLDSQADIVIYCRSGQRSRAAQTMLLAAGFKKIRNLTGGLLAWFKETDAT